MDNCNPKKLILTILSVILSVMTLTTVISASNMNGLGVSSDRVAPGDTFTVYVDVPPSANADTAYIKVEFDASAFEVVSWSPAMSGAVTNSGDGFFVLTAANAFRDIALGSGYRAEAVISVRYGAARGTYSFRLTEHSISYISDDGIDYVEVWQPAVTEVAVSIGDRSASDTTAASTSSSAAAPGAVTSRITPSWDDDDTTSVTRVTTSYNYNYNTPTVATQYIYTSRLTQPAPGVSYTQPTVDIPADTLSPTDGYDADTTQVPTYTAPSGDGEIELFDETAELDTYLVAETERSAASTKNNDAAEIPVTEIELRSKLNGLTSGKTVISTQREFFGGSVDILLSNTDSSETYARSALKSLGLSGSAYYAFDISISDMASDGQIHSLPGGYIDFWVPVPRSLSGGGYTLRVYHIENGRPTLVSANAAADGGTRIYFRAYEFSPYMIVGITNGTESMVVPSNTVPAAGNDGARNPHTGTAAAILLPAAFGGCFVLLRRNKGRKRSGRRK